MTPGHLKLKKKTLLSLIVLHACDSTKLRMWAVQCTKKQDGYRSLTLACKPFRWPDITAWLVSLTDFPLHDNCTGCLLFPNTLVYNMLNLK